MQVMKCSRLENILFRRVEMMELLLTLGFFVELPIDLEKYRSES